MSSKLSQMRDQFRERLTIRPADNKSEFVIKVSDGNNNNITKSNPVYGAQKTNTTVNSRITTVRKNIPQVSRYNTNNSSVSSFKVTEEKSRINPRISRVVPLNAKAQRPTNSVNRFQYKIDSKESPVFENTPKSYARVNQNSANNLLPPKSRGIIEFSKKKSILSPTKSRVTLPLKSTEKFKREPFQRGSSEGTPCSFCGRCFALTERLQKHESVCVLTSHKTRTQFDSTKQRFNGQPKDYLQLYENSLKNPSRKEANKCNWRAQHQYFISAIRAAKGDPSGGPSTSQIIASTQEQCNYCKRRFNDDALKRHVPICAKLYHKKVLNFK